VTAAALTVASLSFVSSASAQMNQDTPKNADTPNRTADRAVNNVDAARDSARRATDGVSVPTNANNLSPDAPAIRKIIGQVTEAAVTKGAFDDLAERFSSADRKRLDADGVVDKDQPELDALATRLSAAWKAKYGHAFKIDGAAVYNAGFLSVAQSDMIHNQPMSNDAMVTDRTKEMNPAGMKPVDGNRTTASGRTESTQVDPNGNTNTRTDTVPNTGAEVTTKRDGGMIGPAGKSGGVDMTAAADQKNANDNRAQTDVGARDGEAARTDSDNTVMARDTVAARDIAMVTIPASHGLPELQIKFVREGVTGGWRIDLPDNVDGATLQRSLTTHLNAVASMQAQWPADENEAYRAVSHHVLAAVQNVASPMASGAE